MKLRDILATLPPDMMLEDGANEWKVRELIKALDDKEAWARCNTCGITHLEEEYALDVPKAAIFRLRGGFRDPAPIYKERC